MWPIGMVKTFHLKVDICMEFPIKFPHSRKHPSPILHSDLHSANSINPSSFHHLPFMQVHCTFHAKYQILNYQDKRNWRFIPRHTWERFSLYSPSFDVIEESRLGFHGKWEQCHLREKQIKRDNWFIATQKHEHILYCICHMILAVHNSVMSEMVLI